MTLVDIYSYGATFSTADCMIVPSYENVEIPNLGTFNDHNSVVKSQRIFIDSATKKSYDYPLCTRYCKPFTGHVS